MSLVDLLFDPKSIALIGASHSEEKLGGVILRNLLLFKGKVFPVNPGRSELMGIRAYKTVSGIGMPFDLAVIIRPAPEVPAILRELKGMTKCAIVMSSGFAEIGESSLQDDVAKAGRDGGIRILGPNCMGVFNPYRNLDIFFLPRDRLRRPKKGKVAIVSQSGAVLSCLLSAVRSANTGVSRVAGYGNAVDIDEADLYEYLADDTQTNVVVSYIESVRDGRRFISNAKMLSRKKPMLVLKSGKGESGKQAAFSHTGRLAGRYEVFHSILRQAGIREELNFDDLMDSTKAFSTGKCGSGRRVCIITNGGGSGVLASDECMRQGLEVARLPMEKHEDLQKVFPHFYGINNPLDLTAQVTNDDYAVALRSLGDSFDGFMIIALPNVLGITEKLSDAISDVVRSLGKPVVCNLAESGISGKIRSSLERIGVPVYPSPERAVRALSALLSSECW